MKLTEKLWLNADLIYQKTLALNFFQALISGKLSPERFHNYLQQDMLYLHVYAKALSRTAMQAPNQNEQNLLQGFADEVLDSELALHRRYVAIDLIATQETKDYCEFLQSSTATDDYFVGIAAILPCYWFYQRIAASAETQIGHPYQEWIQSYTSEAFYQAYAQLCQILDTATELNDAHLSKVFCQACELEYRFHKNL